MESKENKGLSRRALFSVSAGTRRPPGSTRSPAPALGGAGR